MGRYDGKAKRDASKAAAEGCAMLRLSKAAAGFLRRAQNRHVAVSKPTRNSLWGLYGEVQWQS